MRFALRRSVLGAAAFTAVLLLAACGESTPEVTPAPTHSASPSTITQPSADSAQAAAEEQSTADDVASEEATEETTGTREAPLALGETRKISRASAWIVGIVESDLDAEDEIRDIDPYLEGPAEGERFVIATLSVSIDASALEDQGFDINEGVDPYMSIFLEYVGSDGRGYDESRGSMCFTDDPLSEVGAIYEDGVTVTGDICLSVPESAIDGGLWRISNLDNDAVWVEAS